MSPDIVSLALDHILALERLVEKCNVGQGRSRNGKPGEGVTRRLKDLPTHVAYAGLVPALTFYMSKASETTYARILSLLRGEITLESISCDEKIVEDLGGGEKAGYSATLALAVAALEKIVDGFVAGSSFRELAEALRKLKNDWRAEMLATHLLIDYLVEAKKLGEALLKRGKEA